MSLKEQQPALSIDDQVENLEKLGLIIRDKNRAKAKNISNIRIFGIIYCISLILPKDLEWLAFVDAVDDLLMKFANVDKDTMGFPDNWQELLKKV